MSTRKILVKLFEGVRWESKKNVNYFSISNITEDILRLFHQFISYLSISTSHLGSMLSLDLIFSDLFYSLCSSSARVIMWLESIIEEWIDGRSV